MHIQVFQQRLTSGTFVVIPTHDGAVQRTHPVHAGTWAGAKTHDVPQAGMMGTALLISVTQHCLQGLDIAVNITENCELHREEFANVWVWIAMGTAFVLDRWLALPCFQRQECHSLS